ncbi:MAG: hypothetical protein COY19_12455 [Candidatus Marinimicrobia bacterium CG_4_10_14_0_2_um_filter_48_9]|nr:MAG: hypothetical protein COY19_12455 [Candidatus Marinimicrobia bacterium CG_4_10_14_0_2_um_filter_48_9]
MPGALSNLRTTVDARDTSTWQVTYSSLLTAVLAFFILLISQAESEVASTYKFADRLKSRIYGEIMQQKMKYKLDWLYVENTGTKGIKLLIPTQVHNEVLFRSGEAVIDPAFIPYLQHISNMINAIKLESIFTQYAKNIKKLNSLGKQIIVQVRVEGHSDKIPIHTARFADNWELSTARAYTVMEYLELTTHLPSDIFTLAGYGAFHPFRDMENLSENRRVEIYLDIQMIEGNGDVKI